MTERIPVPSSEQRIDALEGAVAGLQSRFDGLDQRTQTIDRKLDQLLIKQETNKPHEPTYYISIVAGVLLIIGALLGASNWYIRSAVGDTVGAAIAQEQRRVDIVELRLKRIEAAIAWTPSFGPQTKETIGQ